MRDKGRKGERIQRLEKPTIFRQGRSDCRGDNETIEERRARDKLSPKAVRMRA